MSNTLVAYFSASGKTAKIAKLVNNALHGDLYEIEPKDKYQRKDLNWMNPGSRSSQEMKKNILPELANKDINIDDYEIIYLGFPIWWYRAPTIINSFLESYDFTNKTIVLFASSGSSMFGKTVDSLKVSAKGATFVEGAVMNLKNRKVFQDWLTSLEG